QFGKRKIVVSGLTQSGPLAEKVWESGIKTLIGERAGRHKIRPFRADLSAPSILILGLGGGSLAKLLNKYFPQAKITGIEIDPLMKKNK
ncbi:MAG: Uncharacterized protein LiPW16_386, partial [Microgenomates group bacterium LiPW_16]